MALAELLAKRKVEAGTAGARLPEVAPGVGKWRAQPRPNWSSGRRSAWRYCGRAAT